MGGTLDYNKRTGNSYAASLYVGLTCLLDTTAEDLAGKRIGLFSYGSGCVAEYFSGVVQPGYRVPFVRRQHQTMLEKRTELTYQQYEDIYNLAFPTDGGRHTFSRYRTGPFRLAGVKPAQTVCTRRPHESHCTGQADLERRTRGRLRTAGAGHGH
jgi:hydroxymethylglutaryl-CoA synthase